MSTVYLVHCIDTEGPLAQSQPTVLTGAAPIPPLIADFDDPATDFNRVVAAHRARTLGTWDEVAETLRRATSREQRHRLPDSFGGGWRFNWFCMDHLGYVDNPRGRAMGMHVIFDFYADLLSRQQAGDALHWHFHPMSTYGEAHRCATSYLNSPMLREIVARRILDRKWFPRASRPGFHDERPDHHWFLEQWLPFDFGNIATDDIDPASNQDLCDGRLSDWRWAPRDWRTYHPHHDCYQLEGGCRRKIARCLNLLNRFGNLTEAEMRTGFARAAQGLPTLIAFSSHDWRDLVPEMNWVTSLVRRVAADYPGVRFQWAEAIEAFNAVHPPPADPPVKLGCTLRFENGLPSRVDVEVLQGRPFGPQPFLALRTRSRRIIHDNMNYWRSLTDFNYIFDAESIRPDDVKEIGVAVNDAAGHQSIHVIDVDALSGTGDAHRF